MHALAGSSSGLQATWAARQSSCRPTRQSHWRGLNGMRIHQSTPAATAAGSAAADGGGDGGVCRNAFGGGDEASASAAAAAAAAGGGKPSEQQQHQPGIAHRIKSWLGSGKVDKQKLAEYGLGAFAAYGIISNLNAGVLMTMSWLAVVKRSGVSPLEGEWAQFLAIYAGLWVGASFMRPIRLSMALAAAPLINAFMDATQRRLRVNRGVAFGLLLGMIAVGSFTLIFGVIALLGGFPNGVPQVPWRR